MTPALASICDSLNIEVVPTNERPTRKHAGSHNELMAAAWLLRQGYDVFRNVSWHGAADLVGMKGGKIELFDVKASSHQSNGTIIRPLLSQEQKSLGVRCLCVFDDGRCEIDDRPLFEGEKVSQPCAGCGKLISLGKYRKRRFCSQKCSAATLASRRAK